MTITEIWEHLTEGVFIIAEAGKNFIQSEEDRPVSEYLANAKELARLAKGAGADAIKFQTHNVDDEQLNIHVVSEHFKAADRYTWVTRNDKATPVDEFWKPLKAYCEEIGIIFFSTPMSRGAAMKLTEVGVPLWKIGSGDILDFVAMDYMRNTKLPIVMSSGMSTFAEVEQGLKFLRAKNSRIGLMHALSKYPGEPEEANLAVIDLYREKFPGVPIGFSENSIGIEPTLIAVAMGVTMIEKHFTIRRDLWGADHKVCSTPDEFRAMVDAIQKIQNDENEKAKWLNHPRIAAIRGLKEKVLKEDEKKFRPLFRKALMTGADITAGTTFTPELVYAMRPQAFAGGLPSERYEDVIGRKAAKDLKRFDPIKEDYLIS